MSNLRNELNPKNYTLEESTQKFSIKDIILKVLEIKNKDAEQWNKEHGENIFKTIKPYSFLLLDQSMV